MTRMIRSAASPAALLLGAAFLSGCAGGDAPAAETEVAAAAEAPAAETVPTPTGRRYGVKSGVLTASVTGFGTGTVVTYFDDWGAKEAIHTTTEIEVMGIHTASRTVTIVADGWQIEYDADEKTGKRWRPVAGAVAAAGLLPDLSTMTDAMKTEYGFQELEPRTYFGREVPGFAMDMAGMKIRGWVRDNIAFRSEMEMGGDGPMVTEVTGFEENVEVPAERFEVPADVTITEIQIG